MVFALIASIPCFLLLFKSVASLRKARRSLFVLRIAESLTDNSELGALVKFSASVTFPENRTPFGNAAASYFRSELRACFVRKRKKPGRGTVTHCPLLHRSSSHDRPLMTKSNEGQPVLLSFLNPTVSFRNLKVAKARLDVLPPEHRGKHSEKYQYYQTEEHFIPQEAPLFVVGELQGKSRSCFTVGEWSEASEGSLVSLLSAADVFAAAGANLKSAGLYVALWFGALSTVWFFYAVDF